MRRLFAILPVLAALSPLPADAACPSVPEVARLARAILERTQPPAPPADLSLADALCARDRLVAVLAQPWGDQVGWNVIPGEPPLAGALLFGTLRARAGESFPLGGAPTLPARFGIVPMVSAGLVLRIRDEGVNEAGADHLAALRHIEAVIPFLDLPDLVHGPAAPWSPALRLSLNLGTRLGVLGAPIPTEATPAFAQALAEMRIVLADATGPLAQGGGAAGPGHPLDALAWLVRDLREQGRRLRGGEHVAIAGLVPAVPAVPGDFAATFTGLAPQAVRVDVRLR